MTIDDIKKQLKRQATIYKTEEIELTYTIGESCIGKVGWQKSNETQPIDSKGNLMTPLATLFLDSSNFIPEQISKYKLITIYMSEDVWDNVMERDLKNFFEIRTYDNLENLVKCDYISDKIKPFPLTVTEIDNDYPLWDEGGIPAHLFETIIEMENNDNISYFNDIFESNARTHKFGGYPSFCQSGYWFRNGYNYVMQISSDEKAKFNIVDNGNFYFYYNQEKNDWKIYCDFI